MSFICYPVLETPELQYSVQPGCGFLDDGYFRATNQVHPANDYNATTGKDTDYGNRIRAIADGVVVEAGDFSGWGGIVHIDHGPLGVYSQSAHLFGITVRRGQQIHAGDVIGQMGKGEHNQFWAHLHFELRRSLLPAAFWPSTRFRSKAAAEAYICEHYIDSELWLPQHGALRTLAEVEAARRGQFPMPTVRPRPQAPPAASAKSIPALPLPDVGERVWEPVYDPDTDLPVQGLWVSLRKNRKTGQGRIYKVEAEKLRAKGLK